MINLETSDSSRGTEGGVIESVTNRKLSVTAWAYSETTLVGVTPSDGTVSEQYRPLSVPPAFPDNNGS